MPTCSALNNSRFLLRLLPTPWIFRLHLSPDKLDPALNSTVDGACLAILNFSGLFTYDENGQLVPELADSYEMSEDGMTYTFTMKDGLKVV